MLSWLTTRRVAAIAAAIALGCGMYGIVAEASGSGASTANAATGKVIPFHRGQPSPSTVSGHVPPGWTAGSGSIVTGTAAKRAKTAAVAAYPGGIVDRVVLL